MKLTSLRSHGAFLFALVPFVHSIQAADLTWNATLPANWNATDANWTGSVWNNSNPDNAIFSNSNGTIILSQAITAGTVSYNGGGRESGGHQLELSGNSLSMTTLNVIGVANGGNVDSYSEAYGHRFLIGATTANVSGNVNVRRGMLYVANGGVLNVSGSISATDAWNVFRMDSGAVSTTAGVDFSPIASQVELYGGTLTTPFIKVGNAAFAGEGGLTMSGATIVATQNHSDFIQIYNNGDVNSRGAATIGSNGVNFNTAGYDITIANGLNGSGNLTKSGSGLLVLSAANGYTGTTVVTGGMLRLDNGNSLGAWRAKDLNISGGGSIVTNWGAGVYNDLGTLNFGGNGIAAGSLTSNQAGATDLGNFLLNSDINVITGSTTTAQIGSDIRVGSNATRNFNIGTTTDASGVDLAMSGKLGHYNGNSWGYINKTGAGTMKLSGEVQIGGITVSGGKLIMEDAAADWSVFAAGMTNNSQVEFSVTSGSRTMTNTVSGSGSLTKTGAGTLTLSAEQSYTGGTVVNGGTLSLSGNQGRGRLSGALTVNSGATVVTTGDGTGLGYFDQLNTLTINGGTVASDGASHIWNITNGVSMTGGELRSNAGVSGANASALEWNRTALTTNASSNSAIISGRVNLRNDNQYSNWSVNVADGAAASDLLVSAAVTGGGVNITKSGAGTMVLSGANTFSGATSINAGTLIAQSSSALGSGGWDGATMTWIYDGATLGLRGGITLDEHLHVFGAGVNGQGAIRSISGNNVLSMTYANSGSGPGFSIDSNTTVGVDADQLTVTGFYETGGSFGLTKVGSGKLVFSSYSTYTGTTTINGGTIEITGRSADNGGYTSLGTGSIVINNGGTLITSNDWALGNEWNGGNVGTVTVNAGGVLTINTAGNTIRNGLVLNGGTVNGTGSNSDWGGLYLKSSSITVGGNATSTIAVDTAIDSAITMNVEAGSQLNYSGPIHNRIQATGGIAKTGSGTLLLSSANTYTGTTSLQEGTLRLENTSALGSGTLSMSNGTTLQLRSNSSTTFNGGNGLGGLGGATINFDVNQLATGNTNQTISFATGGFNTFGTTINVTGGNGYSLALGGINEGFNGSLALNAVSANLSIGNIGSASAVSGLSVGGAANTTISGAINTSGGVNKSGSGVLTLSGTSSYTGNTTVSAGKLVINGNISTSTQTTVQSGATLGGSGSVGALSVESGAFINPGNSPGILNTGNYSQAGTFIAEIAGTTPGTEHDQINVTGTVNLSGALDLQFSASQDYVFNSMIFLILNDSNDAVTGTFTGLAQGATAATFGGFDWVISYTANSTNTTFTGGNDVALMAIPEPSAALLGGLGVLGLLRRRRK
jgi:autotransporter-associated beta strand protein